MDRLRGKVALISGGARGIGEAAARLFVAEGARVMIADVLVEASEGLAADLGETARFIRCDVTASEDWTQAVEATEAAFGPVTVLINNAAVLHVAPLLATMESDFRRIVDVNQVGAFLGMQAVVASMRGARGGSIVNTSSLAGMKGMPNLVAYSASKWAVRGMTKTAALELAPYGIRVNSVHPGTIVTDMNPSGSSRLRPPLGREGRPEEVAQLMCYLASDESSYTTGRSTSSTPVSWPGKGSGRAGFTSGQGANSMGSMDRSMGRE